MLQVQLTTWSVDLDRGPIRLPPRRTSLRGADYEDSFDFTTVFCDVFWSQSGRQVHMVGPPLLNLEADLALDVSVLPERIPCRPRIVHKCWVDLMTVDVPVGTTGIAIGSAAGRTILAPQPNLAHVFAGRRCIFTLNKNNDLAWIRDWTTFYHRVHGCEGVLVYDNGSDLYDLAELNDALRSASGDLETVVIPWPFPYGVFDGRRDMTFGIWDSFYAQTSAFEHARLRALGLARSIVNADIDELALCDDGSSIFDTVERSQTGYIWFDGWWIHADPFAKPIEARRHRHFHHRKREQNDACMPKWAIVPSRCPTDGQWMVHSVAGMAPDEASLGVRFRHFKPINSNWDVDRNLSAIKRTQAMVERGEDLAVDADLRAALGIAFPEADGQAPCLPKPQRNAYALRAESARYAARGNTAEAIVSARAALALDPEHTGFALYLARLLALAGEQDKAATVDAAAIRARESDSYYLMQMGLSAEVRGDLATAERRYRAAADMAGCAPEAHGLLFLLLWQEGRDAEARDTARAWHRICPAHRLAKSVAAFMWGLLGRRIEAIECLEQAIAFEPSAALLTMLAHHRFHAGQLEKAEAAQRAALELYESDSDRDRHPLPSEQVVWRVRPGVSRPELLDLMGRILHAQSRLAQAEDTLREAVRWNPISPSTRLLLADVLEAGGDGDLAAEERRHAAAIALELLAHPADNMLTEREQVSATIARVTHFSNCLARAAAVSEAVDVMRDLVARYPERFAAKWEACAFFMGAERYEEAVDHLRDVLNLRPDHVEAHRELSGSLLHLGRLDEAMTVARRATALDPDDTRVLQNLGFIQAAAGCWEEAVATQSRVLDVLPDDADALRELSGALYHCGRVEDALGAARRAIVLHPNDATLHHHFGFLLAAAEQWAEAAAVQERVLALIPSHAGAQRELSIALHHLGRNNMAIEAARHAVALDPKDPRLHHHLGFLLSAGQRWREAEAAQRRVLALEPNHVDAHRELSGVLYHLGRHREAIALALRAIELAPDDPRLREHLDVVGTIDHEHSSDR